MLIKNGMVDSNEQSIIHAIRENEVSEDLRTPTWSHNPFVPEIWRIGNFSLTMPLPEGRCLNIYEELERQYKDLDFKIIKNHNRYNILAKGNGESLKKLPDHFVLGIRNRNQEKKGKSGISSSFWINYQLNIPFSQLEKEEGVFKVGNKISLDEFLSMKTYSFDTEFMFWEDHISLDHLENDEDSIRDFLVKEGEEVEDCEKEDLIKKIEDYFNLYLGGESFYEQPLSLQIGESTEEGNVVHYFETLSGRNERYKKGLVTGETVIDNKRYQDSLEMVRGLQQFMQENPNGILITQNGMTYDLLQLRKFISEESERRGINEEFTIMEKKPKIESNAGFFSKVNHPSFYHIDLSPYSQNYFPFTMDNKFETIMSLVLGRKIEKKESYNDLTRLTIEQIIGREESGEELKSYACEDVTLLNEVEKYFKTMVYLKGRLFRRNPEDICVTSKKNLGKTSFEVKKAVNTLQPLNWDRDTHLRYENMSSSKEFLKRLPDQTRKELNSKVESSFGRCALYYISPFTNLFYEELKKNPDAKRIFDYLESLGIKEKEFSHQNTLARFDLMNTIEEGYLPPYINEGYVERKEEGLERLVRKHSNIINSGEILNHSENFYCIRNEENVREDMEGLGFKVFEGEMLNFDKGSFAMYDGVNIYKRGIDVKGKSGWKAIYQQELINDMITKCFEDSPYGALLHVSDFFQSLKRGDIDKERLFYLKENISRDYFDYSAPAQDQERVKLFIRYDKMEGDNFAKIKLKDGWYDWDDGLRDEFVFSDENIMNFIEDCLGPVGKRGKRILSKGKIGRYISPLLNYCNVKCEDIISRNLEKNQLPLF